jgi:hypothetical protein
MVALLIRLLLIGVRQRLQQADRRGHSDGQVYCQIKPIQQPRQLLGGALQQLASRLLNSVNHHEK